MKKTITILALALLVGCQEPGAPSTERSTATIGIGPIVPGSSQPSPSLWQKRVSTDCGAGNSMRSIAQDGTATCQSASGGVTNSAGVNVVMKSDGTNAVASSITDNATTFAINTNKVTVTEASGNTAIAGTLTADNGLRVYDVAGNGLTSTGNSVAVNPGAGITADGTSTRLNFPTTACAIAGQAITSHAADGTPTCVNPSPNDSASTTYDHNEEWLGWFAATATNPTTAPPYQIASAGTGAQWQDVAGVTGHPGIIEMASGTTATGKLAIHTSPNAINFGDGSWSFKWIGGVATLSAAAQEYGAIIGFYDTDTSLNQVDGCYFLYDRLNAATSGPNAGNASKLSCWCVQNSTRTTFLMDGSTVSNESFTTVNAPVAAVSWPSTNVLKLEVRMIGTTRAEFWVNDVKSCDINTNIPSGATRLTGAGVMGLKSAGTTSTTMLDTDYTHLRATGLTAR